MLGRIIERELPSIVRPRGRAGQLSLIEAELGSNAAGSNGARGLEGWGSPRAGGEPGSNASPFGPRAPTMRVSSSELGTPFLAGTPKGGGLLPPFLEGGEVGGGRNAPSIERAAAPVEGGATDIDRKAPSVDKKNPSVEKKEASVGRKAPVLEGKAAGAIVGWARRRLQIRTPKPIPKPESRNPNPETRIPIPCSIL